MCICAMKGLLLLSLRLVLTVYRIGLVPSIRAYLEPHFQLLGSLDVLRDLDLVHRCLLWRNFRLLPLGVRDLVEFSILSSK